MKKFTNPLDNIKIASPCPADWDKMYGDERSRFCSQCNLNVYNLSDMTKQEAENYLINSEGRVCITFYRRNDGTVLTNDCPVGWQKLKKKISRVSTAVFTLIASFSLGQLAFRSVNSLNWLINLHNKPVPSYKTSPNESKFTIYGTLSNLSEIKDSIIEEEEVSDSRFTGGY